MMSTEVEQYFRTVGLDPIPRGNTVYMLKGEVGYSSAVQNHWVIPTFKTSFKKIKKVHILTFLFYFLIRQGRKKNSNNVLQKKL